MAAELAVLRPNPLEGEIGQKCVLPFSLDIYIYISMLPHSAVVIL